VTFYARTGPSLAHLSHVLPFETHGSVLWQMHKGVVLKGLVRKHTLKPTVAQYLSKAQLREIIFIEDHLKAIKSIHLSSLKFIPG
jgi:hypothetical protein